MRNQIPASERQCVANLVYDGQTETREHMVRLLSNVLRSHRTTSMCCSLTICVAHQIWGVLKLVYIGFNRLWKLWVPA